jgi:hypothetical protein
MKIFLGPCEIAGYFSRLERALNSIGVSADFFNLENEQTFSYQDCEAKNRTLFKYYRFCLNAAKCRGLVRLFWRLSKYIYYRILIFIIVVKYDSFIFSAGRTFFSGWELPILRLLNKNIVFVYLGSDSRPPYLNGVYYSKKKWRSWSALAKDTRMVYKKIRWQEIWASYIIDHPPSGAAFRNRPFIPYLRMGYPFYKIDTENEEIDITKTIKIVHAPSLPEVKGTELIKSVLHEYNTIGLVELINRPNKLVLEEISTCDFVFDEIYSDTTLGALGTEAAGYAKPTLISGYVPLQAMCPGADHLVPPGVYVSPEELSGMAKKLISNSKYRRELGEKARSFIIKNWNPEIVASKYVCLFKKQVPSEWFCDPKEQKMCYSYGMSESILANRLSIYIRLFGENKLYLKHSEAKKMNIMKIVTY